jgi:hypothetical protein
MALFGFTLPDSSPGAEPSWRAFVAVHAERAIDVPGQVYTLDRSGIWRHARMHLLKL